MIFLLKLFVITASKNFYPPPFGAAKHSAAEETFCLYLMGVIAETTILVIFACSVDILSVSKLGHGTSEIKPLKNMFTYCDILCYIIEYALKYGT